MAKADLHVKLAGGQQMVGGFSLKPASLGNISGSFTPNPLLGNYQFGSNNGAITFNVPSVDCAMDLLFTNTASAGAITFSGYNVSVNVGEPLTTANGSRFLISIRRINSISTYVIKALQ